MTPEFAVGMGGSIRARIREKNRWSGKAMFTESHESGQEDVLMVSGLTPSRASSLPHWIYLHHKSPVGASLLAIAITRSKALPSP
jgi:hypothetical protein